MPAPLLYNLYDTNPVATVDAHVLGLLSASSPLVYSNLTGVFTIQQASGAQAGFVSAADWTVFSAKQAALTLPLSIANGGTNNAGPFTAGSVIFSNGTSLAQDNAKFFWDDTAFALCIGTATQAGALTIVGATGAQNGCSIIAGDRGAATGVGGALTFKGGVGGSPTPTGAGGAGGGIISTGGLGGTSLNSSGGVGGNVSFVGGQGGISARAAVAAPSGGAVNCQGGAGGTNTLVGGSGTGGTLGFLSGPGGNSSNSGPAGAGGPCNFTSGGGGTNTSSGNAGSSGTINFTGSVGGAASGAGTGGNGGSLLFTAGAGGTSASGTGGNGGSLTFIPGAGSGAGTNGSMIFGNAAAQIVNFVAGSGAAAPSTSVGIAIVNYYGSSATNFLATPNAWLSIQSNGVAYRLPLYT